MWLFTDPIGEEVLEGTMGGLLAGLPGLAQDQSLGQTALQTAAAIAGGIGIGALGRRLGARLGSRIHKEPLANQDGQLATLGRLLGSETTAQGFGEQSRAMMGTLENNLRNRGSAVLMQEAAENPVAFAAKYGISADELSALNPLLNMGSTGVQSLEFLAQMKPEQRKQFIEKLTERYAKAESLIGNRAADTIDESLDSIAASTRQHLQKNPEEAAQLRQMLGFGLDDVIDSLRTPASPITGEHIGRAVGRFIGDEVGVLGGLAAGGALAGAMGMESPKDRQIQELKRRLQQQEAAR